MGKPVVGTSVACAGLDVCHGGNALVADEPGAFAEATISVLKDPGLRRRLGTNGKRTVEKKYDWNIIERKMSQFYKDVVRGG